MKSYDRSVEVNQNPNWGYIPDHPSRIWIIGGSGSGKTNLLLDLRKHQQPDICQIYCQRFINQLSIKESIAY